MLTGGLSLDYLLPSLELSHVQSFVTITQQSLYAAGIFALVRSPKDVIWVPVSILGSTHITSIISWIFLWRAGFRFRFAIAPRRWATILAPSMHYAGSTLMSNLYHRTGYFAVRCISVSMHSVCMPPSPASPTCFAIFFGGPDCLMPPWLCAPVLQTGSRA